MAIDGFTELNFFYYYYFLFPIHHIFFSTFAGGFVSGFGFKRKICSGATKRRKRRRGDLRVTWGLWETEEGGDEERRGAGGR